MESVMVTFGKSGDRVTDMADVSPTGKKKIGKWYIPKVLSEITAEGSVFRIGFREKDGTWSEKEDVMLMNNNSQLFKRKKLSRNGLLKLHKRIGGHPFEVYIDLLVEFNGMRIEHLM